MRWNVRAHHKLLQAPAAQRPEDEHQDCFASNWEWDGTHPHVLTA